MPISTKRDMKSKWIGTLKFVVDIPSPPGQKWTKQLGSVKSHPDGWLAYSDKRRIVCASADEAVGWVLAINAVEKGIL